VRKQQQATAACRRHVHSAACGVRESQQRAGGARGGGWKRTCGSARAHAASAHVIDVSSFLAAAPRRVQALLAPQRSWTPCCCRCVDIRYVTTH
jgi:hypothetical protein